MSALFRVEETPLDRLVVIHREGSPDSRGFFERLYCHREFETLLGDRRILQINRSSTSRRGTVRGLHFQVPPAAETKVVTCLRGEVFDVAVDVRQGSPTFLQCHGVTLSGSNGRTFIIPEGFAHGFQTLTDDCEMLYFHTAFYDPAHERGLDALDRRLAIDWPLPVAERSARDLAHPLVDDEFDGVRT